MGVCAGALPNPAPPNPALMPRLGITEEAPRSCVWVVTPGGNSKPRGSSRFAPSCRHKLRGGGGDNDQGLFSRVQLVLLRSQHVRAESKPESVKHKHGADC